MMANGRQVGDKWEWQKIVVELNPSRKMRRETNGETNKWDKVGQMGEITTEQGSFLHKIWELRELEAVWGIINLSS